MSVEGYAAEALINAQTVQDHVHNLNVAFGVAAIPTATHFADIERLTPFLVTSGNGTFGAVTNVLGSGDTPVRSGMLFFDAHEIHITAVSVASQWILRFIFGTATQTEAQAEAAMQYTNVIIQQATVTGFSFPQEARLYKIPSGSQLWMKGENATNAATFNFLFQLHEYPSEPH
jgi:hypothetical protein